MISVLLDTQVFVWLVNGDRRIGSSALAAVSSSENRLLLSYFSLFEITIKASIGKMTYDDSLIDDLTAMGIEVVMPSREHLRHYRLHSPDNKDPFDNILLAVALTEGCEFMTSDAKVLATQIKGLKFINAFR